MVAIHADVMGELASNVGTKVKCNGHKRRHYVRAGMTDTSRDRKND
jgi:hypothetical protein